MGNRGGRRKGGAEQHQQQHDQPEPEDWCFECKNGGELVICDHRNCGKVYHPDPDCTNRDHSFFAESKSWICARHYCYECCKSSKYYCLGCPNALCKKCLDAPKSAEFTIVRGDKGLCVDCMELVTIIERNLDHDSDGNKISVDDRETCEGLFKEYWEIIKGNEGLTRDDVFAAQTNFKKVKKSLFQRNASEEKEEKQNDSMSLDSDEDYMVKRNSTKRRRTNSSDEDCVGKKRNSAERKKSNPLEFVGWASEPLVRFLKSIGKYSSEPLTQWDVRTLVYEYIKEKGLYLSKDKKKFFPDENLFPIFRKTVMSSNLIYPRLEKHFAETFDESDGEENNNQNASSPADENLDDQATGTKSRLSGLTRKHLLKKGDLMIKTGRFASISESNIKYIYLKQSLVLELSKKPESFAGKVVGAFVRVKVVSDGYHLARVIGVKSDEIFKGILLQVSFMPKAIPISELSDADFTEEECKDLQQKVKANLLQKLTVVELQEKAKSLHEDITKHWIAARLICLQSRIDRANLRGRNREKIALLEEREQLEQPWKQEQLLRNVPYVSPELVESRYDPDEEED